MGKNDKNATHNLRKAKTVDSIVETPAENQWSSADSKENEAHVTLSLTELRNIMDTAVQKAINDLKSDLADRFDLIDESLKLIERNTNNTTNIAKEISLDLNKSRHNPLATTASTTTSSAPIDIKTKVEEVFLEQQFKQEKRNNLVLYGIPESFTDSNDGTEEDTNYIQNMHTLLKAAPFTTVKVQRLGRNLDKPRPLLVKYPECDRDARSFVLKNGKELRKLPVDDSRRNVYVNRDLTRAERECEAKLRADCKKKNAEGENVIIRRGKIVPRIQNHN